ncbi:MAG: redoxin domain-containing protein [Fimbriimonadales bacterium]|nr:redoxin domain-containing protein [Fimbriimonadales bacterium]MDW8051134.1 redoxin domain-containing protein [Armatimonadota bacterium]
MKPIFATMLLLTAAAGLFAQTASQIMDQTARTYANLQSLRFEARIQTVYEVRAQGTEMRSTDQSTYTVTMARPNRLRLVVRKQDGTTFTALQSDGSTLYIEDRLLQQTLRKAAPKTLREICSEQNLALAGLVQAGVGPLALMAYGDWRPFVSKPKLVRRERVGGRPTYKLTLRLQSSSVLGQMQASGTQTLWIGTQDKLIWKWEATLRLSSRQGSIVVHSRGIILRQERNPKIDAAVFTYQLPQGYKMVEWFELPTLPAESEEASLKGKPAPEFTLKDLSGKEVRLSDYKGKVVVLNIFAHWCGPCHREAPELEKDVWQAYRNREVVVLGVAIWAQSEPAKRAAEFAKQHKLTFPVLVDADNTVAGLYKVQGVPTTYIIDKQGTIHEVVIGADVAAIKRAVEALLQ